LDYFRTNYLDVYDDVRYFALVTLRSIIFSKFQGKVNRITNKIALKLKFMENFPEVSDEVLINNIHKVLINFKISKEATELKFFIPISVSTPPPQNPNPNKRKFNEDYERAVYVLNNNLHNIKTYKKMFQKVWTQYLSIKLPKEIFISVLEKLHENIMPYMTDPPLLLDFLTDSYNMGGEPALLALNGLFILITKYNLDYPDFYPKLYSIFDLEICESAFRERFFKMCYTFLLSPMIPQYMIFAFLKKNGEDLCSFIS